MLDGTDRGPDGLHTCTRRSRCLSGKWTRGGEPPHKDNNMKMLYFFKFIEVVENKLVKVDEVYDMRLLFQN